MWLCSWVSGSMEGGGGKWGEVGYNLIKPVGEKLLLLFSSVASFPSLHSLRS